MRVVLVGTIEERQRLRRAVAGTTIEIVGEARTIAAARAEAVVADALLVGRADGPRDRLATAEALTPREVQVLELVAEGLPNKAIAVRLDISDQTVKFHVASICGKLGATNRTDAVRRAVQRGLITL